MTDEEVEKRAILMQKTRNPKNDIKEEFIDGFIQGSNFTKHRL